MQLPFYLYVHVNSTAATASANDGKFDGYWSTSAHSAVSFAKITAFTTAAVR